MNLNDLSIADLIALRDELKPTLAVAVHDYANLKHAGKCARPEALADAEKSMHDAQEQMKALSREIRHRIRIAFQD